VKETVFAKKTCLALLPIYMQRGTLFGQRAFSAQHAITEEIDE
jgi:hypothetical protein